MAIKYESNGWELNNIFLTVEKLMSNNKERKINSLLIDIYIPNNYSEEKINFLKEASRDCPVTRNISESMEIKISWHYKKGNNNCY